MATITERHRAHFPGAGGILVTYSVVSGNEALAAKDLKLRAVDTIVGVVPHRDYITARGSVGSRGIMGNSVRITLRSHGTAGSPTLPGSIGYELTLIGR